MPRGRFSAFPENAKQPAEQRIPTLGLVGPTAVGRLRLGGLPDYATFTHAIPLVPWPGLLARLLTIAILGFSVGAALSGWWWLLQERRAAGSTARVTG